MTAKDEWITLINNLGGDVIAGIKLKEIGTTHWNNPNSNSNNSSGFSALPGGYRWFTGYFGNIGMNCYFWSSTEYNIYSAWFCSLNYFNSNVNRAHDDSYGKSDGYSVRCIKNK